MILLYISASKANTMKGVARSTSEHHHNLKNSDSPRAKPVLPHDSSAG